MPLRKVTISFWFFFKLRCFLNSDIKIIFKLIITHNNMIAKDRKKHHKGAAFVFAQNLAVILGPPDYKENKQAFKITLIMAPPIVAEDLI